MTGASTVAARPRRRAIRIARWLAFAAGAAIAVRLFATADRTRVLALLAGVGPKLGLVLVPLLVGLVLECWGWRRVLAAMGGRARISSLLAVRLSTEPLRVIPGGALAAEAAKPFLLHGRLGVPLGLAGASVAVTKSLVVLAQVPYLALAWAGSGGLVAEAVIKTGDGHAARLVVGALAGGALMALVAALFMMSALGSGSVGRTLLAWTRRIPIHRLRAALERRELGFRGVDEVSRAFFARGPRVIVPATGLFFVQWFTEAGETFLVARLLGIPIGFGFALAFEALTSLLRALAFFLPGGIGLQDALQVLLVQTAGVSDPVTVGAAFLFTKRMKEGFWIVVGSSCLSLRKISDAGRKSDRAE